MQGNAEALGTLLENYRAYLTVLAQRYLDPRLNGRLDPADMVQVTFLEAQRDLASFRGHQIEELLGWLRNICETMYPRPTNAICSHRKDLLVAKFPIALRTVDLQSQTLRHQRRLHLVSG